MMNSSNRLKRPTSINDQKIDKSSGRIKSGGSKTESGLDNRTKTPDKSTNERISDTKVANGVEIVKNDKMNNEINQMERKDKELKVAVQNGRPEDAVIKSPITKQDTKEKSEFQKGKKKAGETLDCGVDDGTNETRTEAVDKIKDSITNTNQRDGAVSDKESANKTIDKKRGRANDARDIVKDGTGDGQDTVQTDKVKDEVKEEKKTEIVQGKSTKPTSEDKMHDVVKKEETPPDPNIEKYKRYRNLPTEEAIEKMKWVVEELKALKEYDKGVTKLIMMLISGMYFDYKTIRQELAEILVSKGFPELSLKIIKEFNKLGLFKTDDIWFPAYFIYNTWWNYSDASIQFAEALAEHNVVTLLTINCSHKPYLETYNTSKNVFYVIKASISILHNIARVGMVKHHFDDNKTSEVLAPFLHEDDEMLKILANLTIAHIVDEDTNKKQILGQETIECIINWTDAALKSTRQRYRGFTPFELVDGLNKLAVNDSNKMTIVDKGVIPVAIKMLATEDTSCHSSACRLLWTLSFDKNVREKIKENSELMELLDSLKTSPDSQVKKNASGALWVIGGENDITAETRQHSTASKQHVMLSYSWSDKETVLKIKDKLKAAGYTVWIDVERMGGSTLEAMAEAIEQAAVVLLCMSEKYKNSPNCRTEAEYTFQLRKNYIPLMMQKKYKPDGWLGIILGAKLYFDFSGKYPFDKPFQGLLKELLSISKEIPSDTPSVTQKDETDGPIVASRASTTYAHPNKRQQTLTSLKSSVLSMGQTDVSSWLQNEAKLSGCLSQFEKFKIDGRLLTQLIVMRSEAPEFFYQCLEKRLNMDLTEILQFTCAIDELEA